MSEQKNRELFINGQWVAPAEPRYLPVYNPSNGQVIAQMAVAGAADVDRAATAARDAFESGVWRGKTGAERAAVLRRIADELNAAKHEIALLEALDNGKTYKEAEADVGDSAYCFQYFAKKAEELDARQGTPITLPDNNFKCELFYEPVGVVVAIIPWNYPLLMLAWKVAPALAAGCSVILKPSELTPLSAYEFAKLSVKAGVPAGAFNLVTGAGETGQHLINHRFTNKVAFTGSVPTGVSVGTSAIRDVKRVTLELGGKSPIIVFDDADIMKTVEWVMFGVFVNSGQVCSSTSRLILHENIADTFLAKLVEAARSIRIVDPNDEKNRTQTGLLGPVVSARQRDRIFGFIQDAVKEGAQLLCGGKAPDAFPNGYYVEPTVLRVQPHHAIWSEEVFGPVLSVVTFKTEQEAVRIANDSEYGLAGAVMSADEQRCNRIARALRVGIMWINCSQPCFCDAPWGGFKRSGIGRELGPDGLNLFLEVKQVTSKVTPDPLGWYDLSSVSKL